MNELLVTEAFIHIHNWRGRDEVILCNVEGTLILKVARRWTPYDNQWVGIINATEHQIKHN